MPQDAFTISYVAKELYEVFCGGKISKITQPDRDTVTFIIYTGNGSVKLDACLSARLCRLSLTAVDKPAPKTAPAFCMLLRKRLQNAEITNIRQISGERVVVFTFESDTEFEVEELELYFELMGKYSNAVLTKDGVILGALKPSFIGENTKRVLFPGVKYVLPEAQDKLDWNDLKGISEEYKNACDPAKFISQRIRGVAYSTAVDICETFGGKPTAGQICKYLTDGYKDPCVTENDFKARYCGKDGRKFSSVLEAQKVYYDGAYLKDVFDGLRRKLEGALASAIKKAEKRLQLTEERLLECRDLESVKLSGELITANIYAVKKGDEVLEAVNYYDEKGGKIKIRLDKTLTPAQNAQRYYKRYAKLKRTAEAATLQKKQCEERLEYLNSIAAHLKSAECYEDLEETEEELKAAEILKDVAKKEAKKKPVPFRVYRIGGFRILAGRNNLQNDRLIKSLSPEDIWLHAQKYHSSHVAILCGEGDPDDGVLLKAAEICAYYSDGRGGGKVPVDYTRRKFVKKPPASNAGFVTYTQYKTILVTPASHAEDMIN